MRLSLAEMRKLTMLDQGVNSMDFCELVGTMLVKIKSFRKSCMCSPANTGELLDWSIL